MKGIMEIELHVNGDCYTVYGVDEFISGEKSIMNFLKLFGFTDPIHSHDLIKGNDVIKIRTDYDPDKSPYVRSIGLPLTPTKSKCASEWNRLLFSYRTWVVHNDYNPSKSHYTIVQTLLDKSKAGG